MIQSDSPSPIAKILVVDDHPAIREALCLRISTLTDMTVCAEAGNVIDAVKAIETHRPHLAIVDISLKTGCGLDLVRKIRDRYPSVKTIVWSSHSESLYAERAIGASAMGFIHKDQATEKIIEAIRHVLAGNVYLSAEMAQRILQRNLNTGRNSSFAPDVMELLANRELEVFRHLGEGKRTAEIAQQMHLSPKTIETYRERIKDKLRLKDARDLVRFAENWLLENA